MKKVAWLIGVGIGFLLGSFAGKGPYEKLESKVRGLASREDVQATVSQIKDTAKDQAAMAASKVTDKLPPHGGGSAPGAAPPIVTDAP